MRAFHIALLLSYALSAERSHAQSGFIVRHGELAAVCGVGMAADGTGYTAVARVWDRAQGRYRADLFGFGTQGQQTSRVTIGPQGSVFAQAMASAGTHRFVAGSVIPPGAHTHGALLMKLDAMGNVQWTTTPDMQGDQQLYAVAALPDGGAVACGVGTNGGPQEVLVMRFSSEGDLLWSTSESGWLDQYGYGIAVHANGMMVAGGQRTFGGGTDALFIHLDLDGQVTASASWGGIGVDIARAIVRTADGHFVMAGTTNSEGPQDQLGNINPQVWVMKLNTQCDTLWTRTHGDIISSREAWSIALAGNGDLLLGGEVRMATGSDAMGMRLSPAGSLIWERAWGLGRNDRVQALVPLSDGLAATGWTFGDMGQQLLLIRRNAQGDQ